MKALLLILCAAAGLHAQNVVSNFYTGSFCGSRADMDHSASPKCYFDTTYNLTCSAVTKSDGLTPLWSVMQTNCGAATTTADGGSIAKTDVTTPLRVAAGGPIPNDANCGNPGVSADGVYLLFQCQTSTHAVTTDPYTAYDPGLGFGYVLYGCKLPCTAANVGVVMNQTILGSPMVGGLDPHFFPWDDNTIYFSVQEQGTPTQIWSLWVETLNWGTGAAPPTITGAFLHGRYQPGNWATFAGANASNCDQYYKASGVTKDSLGNVTMYTQIDQVPFAGSLADALQPNRVDGCYAFGGTLRQSGLASFVLDATVTGSGYQLIYPVGGRTNVPKVSVGEHRGYAEFPTIVPTTDTATHAGKLIFICNEFSNRLGFLNDQNEANHHDDWCVSNLDGSGLSPITNYDNVGSYMYGRITASTGLAAGAHGALNATNKRLISRIVSTGVPDRIILFDVSTVGLWPTTKIAGTWQPKGYLQIK